MANESGKAPTREDAHCRICRGMGSGLGLGEESVVRTGVCVVKDLYSIPYAPRRKWGWRMCTWTCSQREWEPRGAGRSPLSGGVCGRWSRASPASRAPWEWSAKGPGMVTVQESLQYRMKPDSEQVLRRKDAKNSEGRVQRECEISATEREGRDGLRLGSELATELAGNL